jgi:hypothetical protein
MDASTKGDADTGTTLRSDHSVPIPGSTEERWRFAEIQKRLAPLFQRAFPDPHTGADRRGRGDYGVLTGQSNRM